jgi:CRP-like cAMP-binding protein
MARAVTADLLKKAPLFGALPAPALGEVAADAALLLRRAGARIFEEGSPSDSCYVLTAGRAKIVIAGADGTEITIGFALPFALVGEIGVIDRLPRSAGFVAVDDCRLVRIPARRFLRLIADQAFNQQLTLHIAATLRRATEQLRAIYTFDARERVAWSVAQVAALKGEDRGHEIVITPKPSHRELAEMTGSSRETVSRALLRLREQRWLRWDATSVYMDRRAFRRYFGPSEAADLQAADMRATMRAV